MRLKKFQIKNYCSIVDSGIVTLSEEDNVLVFAGQNESGKSSILKALYDFEQGEFRPDSLPFFIDNQPIQTVSCTYKIEQDDDIADTLSNFIIKDKNLELKEGQKILDKNKIRAIQDFTITRTNDKDEIRLTIDTTSFKIFQSSILQKPEQKQETQQEEDNKPDEAEKVKEKYINITDEQNSEVAGWFWKVSPKIVFFDDFCDLLPNKIFISDLRDKKTNTKGYKAVKNLERILKIDFVKKDKESDSVRKTKEDKENKTLSVDFQKDWAQRIHGENKVVIKYDFQKRNGKGEGGSYINFYVETKEGQLLPPEQRSKGLIWFLSLWLELKAQDTENNDLVLLLDEPDQHLHVKAQKDILKLISKLSGRVDEEDQQKEGNKSDQIFYATHSPYLIEIDFLNRIKLVLNMKKEGTKIEDIVTSKIDTTYKKDALQPIANAIGFNVSEFSPLQKKNVILEGVSDYYYFLGMKSILEKTGDYAFVPSIGVRQINNLISMSIGYGLSWIAIIDDDPKKGGKDSKKKFDEIKKFVFSGDMDKTKEKVHILEGIVGIENMFTHSDLKLIDSSIQQNDDKTKVVGHKRKILFSKLFFEKVKKREITKDNISKTAKNKFGKVFDFIENNFKESNDNF